MSGPLTEYERAGIFVEAITGPNRLDHPEGIAVAPDGAIWAGGEGGQIYRIAGDPPAVERRASTGGFCLGLAFDHEGTTLYVCDLEHAALIEVDVASGQMTTRSTAPGAGPIGAPNYPVVLPDGSILVSDSSPSADGASIWRFPPRGTGRPWYPPTLAFANGMAYDGHTGFLDVVEGHARRLVRIGIDIPSRGAERVADLSPRLPDGVAIGASGRRYVGCYAPNEVVTVDEDGSVSSLVSDPDGHLLAAPTNLAFRGSQLFVANLSRWHITVIDTDDTGAPVPTPSKGGG